MNTDWFALKEQFDWDGYAAMRGFLTLSALEEIELHLGRYQSRVTSVPDNPAAKYEIKNRPETLKLLQLSGCDDAYWDRMLRDTQFVQLAEILLGDKVTPKTLQWLNKPPQVGVATPPHQDGFYYMLQPNEAVALWVALDHATPDNGCMRYGRGSRQRGLRPHSKTTTLGFSQAITDYGDADAQLEEAVSTAPGDLIAHHSLTIHRADANHSNRHRRALQFVYFAQRAREDTARKAAYQQQLQAELAKAGRI